MAEQLKMDDYMALEIFTRTEAKFKIGDKTFIMKPLVPKKLRELIKVLKNGVSEIQAFQDLDQGINFAIDKMTVLFPIIFDIEVSQDFVDNNISIPLCKEIWETFVKLNTLEGMLPFFQKAMIVKIAEINQTAKN